jgi:hypothetical protein
MKQPIKPILFCLTLFSSNVLFAASWQSLDAPQHSTHPNATFSPPPDHKLVRLEQKVLASYQANVGNTPDIYDLSSNRNV